MKFEPEAGGLKVIGQTTDTIGKLAYDARLPILELANQEASLEQVFLELTENEQEFGAHKETK